jgi:hypothetical protein
MTAYNFSQIVPYTSAPPKYEAGMRYSIDFEYTLAGAVVSGDTWTTPANALPNNGIRIIDTSLHMSRLDTNAAPTATLSVGDSGSATRFISGANAGSAISNVQLNLNINQAQTLSSGVVSAGSGYLYAAGTSPQIVMTLGGTVATAASTGVIRLRVIFYCTGEQ